MKKYWRVTFLILFLGTALFCYFQWRALEKLRRENKTLMTQLQEAKTAAESNFGQKFSLLDGEVNQLRTQVKDLPRLRSQVQALRKATNEITKLLAENQKLKAGLPHSPTNRVLKSISYESNSTPGVLIPKENWAFAGYATPEAALQSSLWAASQGNLKAFMDAVSPEMQTLISKEFDNKPESYFADKTKNEFTKTSAYRIERQEEISPDEVKMHVHMEGKGSTSMIMKKFGNEWKLAAPSD